MPRLPIWFALPILAVAGCGGGGGGESPATGAAEVDLPVAAGRHALEIADLLAADAERTPAGFYVDAATASGRFRSTRHVTNHDVDPSTRDLAEFELCANDLASARAWQEADAQAQSAYATVIGTDRSELYFEFVRQAGDGSREEAVRVFDCGFLDRDGVDRAVAIGYEGRLGRLPVTSADLTLLGEYLWTFSRYNNAGHAVLSSTTAATAGGLRHTLVQAERWRGAAARGACDTIQAFERRLDADGSSGRLDSDEVVLWTFDVTFDGGSAVPCPD